MKNQAWTMAELVVAVTILIIISVVSMTIIKPNHQKASIYIYAAIKNLQKGNIGIIEKYDELYPDEGSTHDSDTSEADDWYCINLADLFSLEQAPVCTKESSTNSTKATVNIKLPNGVTIQGLTNSWYTPYTNAGYQIKNIIVDIDGEGGLNKIGADRFPLRVYAGGSYDGIIMPIDCSSDVVYDSAAKVTLGTSTGKSPYCVQGFDAGGSSVTNNFLTDNEVISYDIYRPDNDEEETTASLIFSALAPLEADCKAYGGSGFYSPIQCSTAGYRLAAKCANTNTCADCDGTDSATYNVCPDKNTDGTAYSTKTEAGCTSLAASANSYDVSCFTLSHKPTGGMGFLAGSLLSDFDF